MNNNCIIALICFLLQFNLIFSQSEENKSIEIETHDGNIFLGEIIEENEALGDDKYTMYHFRNIHLFHIDTLSYDIGNHKLVPKHECIRNQAEIQKIYEETNSSSGQLPAILRTDPMAKLLRLAPGDICKISRNSERCGEYVFYRICL